MTDARRLLTVARSPRRYEAATRSSLERWPSCTMPVERSLAPPALKREQTVKGPSERFELPTSGQAEGSIDRPLRVFGPVSRLKGAGLRGLVSDRSLECVSVVARRPQANCDCGVEARSVHVSVSGRFADIFEMPAVRLADVTNWLPPRWRRTHRPIDRHAAGSALVGDGLLELGIRDPKAVLDGEVDTQALVLV
jgi:hypothetical protein